MQFDTYELAKELLRSRLKHFMLDFIITCSIPSLQFFDGWEDFGFSDSISSPDYASCDSVEMIVTWYKRLWKTLSVGEECSPPLLNKTLFWSLMELVALYFFREDDGWFTRIGCWLTSNCNIFCLKFSQVGRFGLLYHLTCVLSCFSVPQVPRRLKFVLMPSIVSNFLC